MRCPPGYPAGAEPGSRCPGTRLPAQARPRSYSIRAADLVTTSAYSLSVIAVPGCGLVRLKRCPARPEADTGDLPSKACPDHSR